MNKDTNWSEAQTIVMDIYNIFRGMIYMTSWHDNKLMKPVPAGENQNATS